MSCKDSMQSCPRWGCDVDCCTTSETCIPGLGCCDNNSYCNDSCCLEGELCINGVCTNPCGSNCRGEEVCIPSLATCCNRSSYCDGICCEEGEVCTNSGCTKPSQTCSCDLLTTDCCYNGDSPYLCCEKEQEVCIPSTSEDNQGECCPKEQYCEGICCQEGWICKEGECVCACSCQNPADCCLDNCQVNPPYLCCNSAALEKCAQNINTGKAECCPADRYLNGKCCPAGWHAEGDECSCNCSCPDQKNCCLDSCYVDPPYICCNEGEQCMRGSGTNRAICCSDERACSDKKTCCKENTVCCDNICCEEGEMCCDGACCKTGHCVEGTCCTHVCLDGTCCDGGGQCCWGGVCWTDGFRSGDQCCFTNPWNIDVCIPEFQQ